MQRSYFSLIFTILMTICLTACSSVTHKKTFSYIPPEASADIHCMNKCYYARKNCIDICVLKNKQYCDCVTAFNTCYSACGGHVITKSMTLHGLW